MRMNKLLMISEIRHDLMNEDEVKIISKFQYKTMHTYVCSQTRNNSNNFDAQLLFYKKGA